MADELKEFEIQATIGVLLSEGTAGVCRNAYYVNRYLLVKDKRSGRLVQVFAGTVIPCFNERSLVISSQDAKRLDWQSGYNSGAVVVVVAEPGLMFFDMEKL